MPEPEERFLTALRTEAANAARLNLGQIQRAFSAAFPHLDGSPNRRAKLASLLDSLVALYSLRLPADRVRGWQNLPVPALPLRITLTRRAVQKATRFDHRSFPWAREIAFVAEFAVLHTPEDVMRIHEFFKNGGAHSPIVPTKERSWQIFGNEKRLDELHCGQFFEGGRLTLDLLRCRSVTQILAFSRAPVAARTPVLIVENESTFHSFCRLNHQVTTYAGVVFGNGNTVLKAYDFLHDLASAIGIGAFSYFGDLDPRGLRIPYSLDRLMSKFGLPVFLDTALYTELLKVPPPAARLPQPADEEVLAWLPGDLRDDVRTRLADFGRVAQEALGWEKLCALYQADVLADFNLGFSP
jgi:hypothetical protein